MRAENDDIPFHCNNSSFPFLGVRPIYAYICMDCYFQSVSFGEWHFEGSILIDVHGRLIRKSTKRHCILRFKVKINNVVQVKIKVKVVLL